MGTVRFPIAGSILPAPIILFDKQLSSGKLNVTMGAVQRLTALDSTHSGYSYIRFS
jgi:hypothetical protein